MIRNREEIRQQLIEEAGSTPLSVSTLELLIDMRMEEPELDDVPHETNRHDHDAHDEPGIDEYFEIPSEILVTPITDDTRSVHVLREQLGLQVNSHGYPVANITNVEYILAGMPELSNYIWYDEFLKRIRTTWKGSERDWTDHEDYQLTSWLQRRFEMRTLSDMTTRKAVNSFSKDRTRNCAREWLRSCVWDGTDRLPTIMSDGFGAPQNAYTSAVGLNWFISMAARLESPGCQVDSMPVFEGWQGSGKTSALRIIGGKWFSEIHESIGSKDFFQSLEGLLIAEFSELHVFKRQEIERIKGIITSTNDRYRSSYGYRTENHPRQCVFAGTTNRDDWNGDETGARRFWPIVCGHVNLEYLSLNRSQLFAEALVRFTRGETHWNVPKDQHEEETSARRPHDPWQERIENWLEGRSDCSIEEIFSYCLEIEVTRQDMSLSKRVGSILRYIGYRKKVARSGGKLQKRWFKGNFEVTEETVL